MYTPPAFAETRIAVLHDLMTRHPFATLVSVGADGAPTVTHLPLLLDADRGPSGTLVGHLAKPNGQADDLFCGRPVTAIFHGPHAYVSPRWYQTTPAVPTWNYAVVHAHGRVRRVADGPALLALLDRTTRAFEPAEGGWVMAGLSSAYLKSMSAGVIGFELEIDRLEGKFKLSQNRSAADQAGVVAALSAGSADDRAVAELMTRGKAGA